jgi:hypothetical protein
VGAAVNDVVNDARMHLRMRERDTACGLAHGNGAAQGVSWWRAFPYGGVE